MVCLYILIGEIKLKKSGVNDMKFPIFYKKLTVICLVIPIMILTVNGCFGGGGSGISWSGGTVWM